MPTTITEPRKTPGIAGQFSVATTVTYENEAPARYEFVGSVYGGPVVMITPSGQQMFVSEPGRFGKFGVEWVRRFFADAAAVV